MRKVALLALVAVLSFGFVGCASNTIRTTYHDHGMVSNPPERDSAKIISVEPDNCDNSQFWTAVVEWNCYKTEIRYLTKERAEALEFTDTVPIKLDKTDRAYDMTILYYHVFSPDGACYPVAFFCNDDDAVKDSPKLKS